MSRPTYTPLKTAAESRAMFHQVIDELFDDDCALIVVAFHPDEDITIRSNMPPDHQVILLGEAKRMLKKDN